MYPFIRLAWQMWKHRKDAPLGLLDTHESRLRCWPWDIDFWMELNNGRTLTLYDLGRMPMASRMGLTRVLMDKKWAMAIVGGSIRYRRRVFMFEKLVMKSRAVAWDDKFFYTEQSLWKANGECASHVLLRSAVTDKAGIVPPVRVLDAMGAAAQSPVPPAWISAWIAAEDHRPWPPMQDAPPQG